MPVNKKWGSGIGGDFNNIAYIRFTACGWSCKKLIAANETP